MQQVSKSFIFEKNNTKYLSFTLLPSIIFNLDDGARFCVQVSSIPGLKVLTDVLDGNQTGNAEFAGNDCSVRNSAPNLGDDARDKGKVGRPANVRREGEQNIAGTDVHRLFKGLRHADTSLHRADGDGSAREGDGVVSGPDYLLLRWLK